jgi:hypothetical protein
MLLSDVQIVVLRLHVAANAGIFAAFSVVFVLLGQAYFVSP